MHKHVREHGYSCLHKGCAGDRVMALSESSGVDASSSSWRIGMPSAMPDAVALAMVLSGGGEDDGVVYRTGMIAGHTRLA